MDGLRCALLDDYQGVALDMADWGALAPRVSVQSFQEHFSSEEAFADRLGAFDVLVSMRERNAFTRERLRRLPRLRLLVATGLFHPEIDFEACAERGVLVCGTQGVIHSAFEFTWALILGLLRRLPDETRAMSVGASWQTTLGEDLFGRTLGIIGLGRIGSRVAQVARAFGMRAVAWSPHLTPERCLSAEVEFADSLDALLSMADIVTLHLVASEDTRGLIGQSQFARMKTSAFLVNTSRGQLVQESALLEALAARQIAGAALDVFDQEPLPVDHPYRTAPNLMITPHLGFVTRDNYVAHYGQARDAIEAWLQGRPIRVLTGGEIAIRRGLQAT